MKRHFLCAALVLSFSGCATLFNSQHKGIMFTSDPTGSEVLVNGQSYGRTPISVNLKQKTDYTVTFRQSGYDDRTYRLNNHVGAGWIILDVLGGVVPMVIDAATGSWYSLEDNSMHGVLPRSGIPATRDSVDVAPAVPTEKQASAAPREYHGRVPIIRGVPFTVGLEDGSVLGATAIGPGGMDMLKVTRADGKNEYVPSNRVRFVVGEDGTDWTNKAVRERASLPKR